MLKIWQDLKSRSLNKQNFNDLLTGNTQEWAKKMTKWEKKIVDFLAKAELDALKGIAGGFKTGTAGIPAEAAAW